MSAERHLPENPLDLLARLGFPEPRPVQIAAMPHLAGGDSLFALAPTGSGKTLAFLLPLMMRLAQNVKATQLLVLAPTRELGQQIAQVALRIAEVLDAAPGRQPLQIRTAFGGQKIAGHLEEMGKNPHLVIATPGRALALMQREVLDLSSLSALVLDEADLLVGMGFSEAIEKIAAFLPKRLQVAFFSATEPEQIESLQRRLLPRAEKIDLRAPIAVAHEYVLVDDGKKERFLSKFLQEHIGAGQSAIVFCQTREGARQVFDALSCQGFSAEVLSGELGQVQRFSILRRFKSGGLRTLVATNMAARGLDVPDLSLVVNFDLPSTGQEYLHRAGRTARAGKPGRVLSLCTPRTKDFFLELTNAVGIRAAYLSRELALPGAAVVESADEQNQVPFARLHLNKGKAHKLRPGDIVGALTNAVGLKRDEVGSIFIFDHFTHIEIAEPKASAVKQALLGSTRIKNLTVKASEVTG